MQMKQKQMYLLLIAISNLHLVTPDLLSWDALHEIHDQAKFFFFFFFVEVDAPKVFSSPYFLFFFFFPLSFSARSLLLDRISFWNFLMDASFFFFFCL